jgi:UDP-glucose 4-epimerase
MERVALITGSTGYIGTHLSALLEASPAWRVLRVDRASGFDLSVPGWSRQLPEKRVDVVFHLAQSRRYREFPDGAKDMLHVNVVSTVELADWAREHEVGRFVLASSGTIYAENEQPLVEEAPCRPATMYAATKLSAELLLSAFSEYMDVVVARLFSVYGPGQSDTLIAKMIDRIRRGQEITLARNSGIHLTPLHVGDCVKILTEFATLRFKRGPMIINVAGERTLSLGSIVKMISQRTRRKAVIRITDEEPRWLCADIGRLREFYTEPLVRFEDGIEETLRHADWARGGSCVREA